MTSNSIHQECFFIPNEFSPAHPENVNLLPMLQSASQSNNVGVEGILRIQHNDLRPESGMDLVEELEGLIFDFSRNNPELAQMPNVSLVIDDLSDVCGEARLNLSVTAPSRLSETSWRVERYEAVLFSLKQSLRVLEQNPAYAAFIDDLKRRVDLTSDEKEVKSLIELIQQKLRTDSARFDDKSYYNSIYHRYHHDFINQLRQLLASETYRDNDTLAASFIRDLSVSLFTEIDLEEVNFRLVEQWVNAGAKAKNHEQTFENYIFSPMEEYFSTGLQAMYEHIAAVPSPISNLPFSTMWHGILGQFNCCYDPNAQDNPIHKMGELKVKKANGNEKIIANLAFGSQTREFCFGAAEAAPEFRDGFLEDYRLKGKRHLYVFHQNLIPPLSIEARSTNCFLNFILKAVDLIVQMILRIPLLNLPLKVLDKLLGNESYRGTALIDLADEEKMKETFYLLALSKDSRFFKQSSSYYSSMNAFPEFEKELFRQFFELERHESGIYLSPNLMELFGGEESFKAIFSKIVGAIHQHMFNGKESLSVEKRKKFIEILYSTLEQYLLVNPDGECVFDSFNTSCRADIDRGMSAEALLEASIGLQQLAHPAEDGMPLDEEVFKKEIAKTFFSRAIQVATRPILHGRFERALQAIQYLSKHLDRLGSLNMELMNNHVVELQLA